MASDGHVFVVMPSYLLTLEIRRSWSGVDATVEEGLRELATLSGVTMKSKGVKEIFTIPRPRRELRLFYELCNVPPPRILPKGSTNADTERKLPSRRKVK